MPEAHAKLSPSAAERWVTCPGSVPMSLGMEQKASAYADEGTLAHAYAEAWLRGKEKEFPWPADLSLEKRQEMHDHVRVYVEHIRDLVIGDHKNPCKLLIEQQVKVSEDCWGTADAIVWDEAARTLHIVDLKYGAGVTVDVRDNLQLRIYALAALLTLMEG